MFLINADDFGMTHGINEAIYNLINEDIINSCSVMCNMPYTQEAIFMVKELLKKGKKFNLNLHFNITEGYSLFDNKKFNMNNQYVDNIDFIKKELNSQINFLKDNGVIINGIDCHHNVNLKNSLVNEIICSIPNIRIRNNNVYKKIYDNIDDKVLFNGLINRKYNEIMIHPSVTADDELKNTSVYFEQRLKEYELIIKNKELIKVVLSKRNV